MTYRDRPLGELAISIPRATRLFRHHALDFCCGGKQTLQRAAARQSLDLAMLESQLAELDSAPQPHRDWQQAPLAELTAFIVTRYHQRHREQLPELVLMAQKVERVHTDKVGCPRGLAKQLDSLRQELDGHMMKEERILFPLIEQGEGARCQGPISVMEHEHRDAGERLEVIRFLTDNMTPPAGACTTWRALYAGISELINDLMEHISLENNLLFPRALNDA
ncbi:iron-sulfur cluster repair protein YtfE [Edwardsiella piscicida]|uniref:iron-sulfur cluster repair protein YtfE n=1 Tax=Edwardsiella piscicida TaxID=1263550 RepID=UPI00054CCC89|nr:iron-sulfur cluster repair protein YtfE [Edwardsiella piscicida]ELM3659116.1 iron-sulfur cluster repair protein YtfE [Edwardsiella piscicida]UCQ41520.1 iron-sulfur cluster repair protein YtfE [Edwardsiella piscicida]